MPMPKKKAQMRMEKKHTGFGLLAWEGSRWLPPGMFFVLTAAWSAFFLLDTFSNDFYVQLWQSGEPMPYDAMRLLTGGKPFLKNIGLCCTVFTGVGIYAQDYEENAAYMRIQRMGARRYAGLRTLQASISSWLMGCASILLGLLLVSLVLQVPLFPQYPEAAAGWSTSRLLRAGQNMEFLVWRGAMEGFCSMFYAVVTLAFSFFVPRRRVLLALPIILWYFNQYALSWIKWIPYWLQPKEVFNFDGTYILGDSESEWGILCRAAIGLTCLAVAVWALFVLRLRRAGTFGGEQIE